MKYEFVTTISYPEKEQWARQVVEIYNSNKKSLVIKLKKNIVEKRIKECIKKSKKTTKSVSKLSKTEIHDLCDDYY
jgi:hypothetical protein